MAAVDVEAVATEILMQAGPILAIGLAVTLVLVVIKAFRWIANVLDVAPDPWDDDGYWEMNDRLGSFIENEGRNRDTF